MARQRLFRKALWRLREQGPRNLWQRVHAYIYDFLRERSLGIDTASWVEWVGAGSDSQCMNYEPLAYWHIERVLEAMPVNPGVDVFVDYGSGKGRVIAVAALRPFKRVIGVELLTELSGIAEENIHRASSRFKCGTTGVVTCDAASYALPPDATHVFLFNPFCGSILDAVLVQIRESWLRHRRSMTIAYVVPAGLDNPLNRCDWLESPDCLSLPHWQQLQFLIYSTVDRDSFIDTAR